MPKYTYKCASCDKIILEYREAKFRDLEKICGDYIAGKYCEGTMARQLPNLMEPTILEKIDTHRNIKHRKDQDKRVRERAKKHFREVEMSELIETVGEEKAKKFGWITKDGKKNKQD